MILADLIKNVTVKEFQGNHQVEIRGITHDSRAVQPGFLFVAIEGFQTDGHRYVADAIKAGASAVVLQNEVEIPSSMTRVMVDNSREALALLAAQFYGHPSHKMTLVGITGTNGKTTTSYLISAIYRHAGQKVGIVGTIANYIGERKLDVSHTTPESNELQKILREMVDEGVQSVVMEVSSHALSLDRVKGCEFDVGVFTNLTQDHLDFHRDMDDYLHAKMKLFQSVGEGHKKGPKFVVVNLDDPSAHQIITQARVPVITYGIDGDADVRAVNIEASGQGTSFTVVSRQGSMKLNMKLAGLFNVYNALAAFSVGMASGFRLENVVESLETMEGVPGRFELIDCGQDFTVVVDYAHTPDGLENILKSARSITSGRLITVFGCGGDRDRTKRPIMGRLAGVYSDLPIVTSDNPRTEDPYSILKEVEEGIKKVMDPSQYRIVPDRSEAIKMAITEAKKGDLVIIAGKGHENYQIIGHQRLYFDDREEARKVMASLVRK